MTDDEYRLWWQLHVRVARGEKLNPLEQASYDAVVLELDATEKYPESEALRNLRERIDALKQVEAQLLEEQRAVDERIARLEARYYAQTGQVMTASTD